MEGYLKANAEKRMVRRVAQSTQALYLAEGGIEWAKAHLMANPDLRRGSLSLDTGQVDIAIETIVIETSVTETNVTEAGVIETSIVETSLGGYKVTAEGRSGLAVRKIRVIFHLIAGKWVLKNYQELHT